MVCCDYSRPAQGTTAASMRRTANSSAMRRPVRMEGRAEGSTTRAFSCAGEIWMPADDADLHKFCRVKAFQFFAIRWKFRIGRRWWSAQGANASRNGFRLSGRDLDFRACRATPRRCKNGASAAGISRSRGRCSPLEVSPHLPGLRGPAFFLPPCAAPMPTTLASADARRGKRVPMAVMRSSPRISRPPRPASSRHTRRRRTRWRSGREAPARRHRCRDAGTGARRRGRPPPDAGSPSR